jgi:bifunctional DNase/RNase
MVTMLDAVDVRVDRIVISDLADETFHARLLLVGTDTRHEVDARPSDAIALAVRIGAPIYATTDVLDRAATSPDDDDDEEDGEKVSGAALEETGEPIDAARLDIFREFVNSLDLDQEGRGGGSTS